MYTRARESRFTFMNRMPGFLFYSLSLIYEKALLHHSSSAKSLEKGLDFIYTHSIQLYSRSLCTTLKMSSHINENQGLESQGEVC